MKKLYRTALLALMTIGLFSSCYKDHSVGVTRPLAVVQPKTELEDLYEVEYGSTLTIPAPEYTVSDGSAVTPSYTWEIGYKVVSREKDLVYTPRETSEYGTHQARLAMETPDGIYYKQFRVRVNFKYREGLYALVDQSGKAAVRYYPLGQTERVVPDILTDAQVDRDFTGSPRVMNIYGFTSGAGVTTRYLFVGFGSPSSYGYKMSADSLTVSYPRISFNNHELHDAFFTLSDRREYYIADTYLYTMEHSTYFPRRVNDARLRAAFSGTLPSLAPRMVDWSYQTFTGGAILFDQTTSTAIVGSFGMGGNRFMRFQGSYTVTDPATGSSTARLGNPFEGTTLVDMSSSPDKTNVALLVRGQGINPYRLTTFNPREFTQAPSGGVNFPVELITYLGSEVPTHLALRPEHNSAYVAAANKVYFYDLQRQVSTPPDALITLGTGETIDYLILHGGTHLYIATSTGSSGAIYCYDVSASTATQLWRDEVPSKVKQLLYREAN